MKIIIEKNYEDVSKTAGKIISDEVRKNPTIVLGLATGSTPMGAYKELIRMHKEEELDFSKVKTFNLDEYLGLDGNNPSSYRYFMDENLFNHINIDKNNTHVPDGKAVNPEEYCKLYDKYIEEAGGIDIQILGVGENGHIAFNEPDNSLSIGTSIEDLTEDTIKVNSRFFDSLEEVPKKAISMGIGSILKARKIILLANGTRKAEAIKNILKCDRISTQNPASFLLLHPDFTLIIDEEAYGKSK
ncbi:glucosamine-6-phosphate deaminase [Tissierella sp. Yu-01]|uniref:glucosamine-6-phosphate deaminase n=1 Tax=Tissierella sp. Yu-01 TaxID=3035694 RepID=UPI00240D9014|nr:glucosamine-6-phosphate deaminase [Tissierella sp. Yu-01]WFA09950.1 glucosamine-6-phosphate deaminase [Tissierella sp. Yu-01]